MLSVALILLCCFGISRKGFAQCATCLQATCIPGASLCSPGCPGCIQWNLTNTCQSCINHIWITSKYSVAFSMCCVVLDDPTHETWTADSISPYKWEIHSECDTCCMKTGESIQITTCGLSPGDIMTLDWTPADPPCISGMQDEDVAVPKPCK